MFDSSENDGIYPNIKSNDLLWVWLVVVFGATCGSDIQSLSHHFQMIATMLCLSRFHGNALIDFCHHDCQGMNANQNEKDCIELEEMSIFLFYARVTGKCFISIYEYCCTLHLEMILTNPYRFLKNIAASFS